MFTSGGLGLVILVLDVSEIRRLRNDNLQLRIILLLILKVTNFEYGTKRVRSFAKLSLALIVVVAGMKYYWHIIFANALRTES